MDPREEFVVTLVRGSATPEEMTALALVLLARKTGSMVPHRTAARWRVPAYGAAHSWRTAS